MLFKIEQVKDVFLPWYNAYRFLVQNAKRLEIEGFSAFSPIDQASLLKSSNVLDHWINSATESLVSFVHQEMDAYRLYTVECLTDLLEYLFARCINFYFHVMVTWCKVLSYLPLQVVPYLVKYIDNLTNIYVRFNRKRLKGRTGEEDCRVSLSTLYHVSIYCAVHCFYLSLFYGLMRIKISMLYVSQYLMFTFSCLPASENSKRSLHHLLCTSPLFLDV